MSTYELALIPGDGIGPTVLNAALPLVHDVAIHANGGRADRPCGLRGGHGQ